MTGALGDAGKQLGEGVIWLFGFVALQGLGVQDPGLRVFVLALLFL